MDDLGALQRFIPKWKAHLSWAGLPRVRQVKAKGRLYWYYNIGGRGNRSYVRLPEPGTSDFEAAYIALDGAQQDKASAEERVRKALEAHEAKRRFVYFIGGEVGAIKIGYAKKPDHRLAEIQIGSPVPLRIMALAEGGSKLEREYHARFAEFRVRGEWFSRSPDILAEITRLSEMK